MSSPAEKLSAIREKISKKLDHLGPKEKEKEEQEDLGQQNENADSENWEHCTIKEETIQQQSKDIEDYCRQLIFCRFRGQTSAEKADVNTVEDVWNLGLYLRQLDALLRTLPDPGQFDSEQSVIPNLLKFIAGKRHAADETPDQCYERLSKDAKRFIEIYKKRSEKNSNVVSEKMKHSEYWGTQQQLISAKVICDWLCEPGVVPMDPIFGVLLHPTTGRTGPGDASLPHKALFDERGPMAYHTAVHDAFGYLVTFHDIGPGYDYRSDCVTKNPFAGQLPGLAFWKKYIDEIAAKIEENIVFI